MQMGQLYGHALSPRRRDETWNGEGTILVVQGKFDDNQHEQNCYLQMRQVFPSPQMDGQIMSSVSSG